MARKYGRCANYGECTLADSHKVIDSTEDNFICPECNKPLRLAAVAEPPVRDNGTRKNVNFLRWLLFLLLLLLLGSGIAAWKLGFFETKSTSEDTKQPSAVTPAPATPRVMPSVPVINSKATLEAIAGESFSYQISSEPKATHFAADKLPDGVSLDTQTGKLTGAIANDGDFTIHLTASTDEQTSAAFPLVITVKPKATSANTILRLHGSNTIGAKLAPALVEAFLQEKGYTNIKRIPVADLEVLIQGQKPNASDIDAVEIKAHGSATAFAETDKNKQVGLLGGYADIGMSSSPINEKIASEFEAKQLGNPSLRAQEHIIGLDGVAVIVNPSNPLDKLSIDKIRKIFLGEIKDWAEVGGQAGAIQLYSRDEQSGTYDTFRNKVLLKEKLNCQQTVNLKCFEDSKELASHVASDPQSIGFVGLNYISTTKALKVGRSENVTAFVPNRFTIKTEDYPISRRLFLYQTNQPKPLAAEFIQFALSDAGQKVVSNAGLVEVAIDQAQTPDTIKHMDADKQRLLDNPAIPKAYKALIEKADRKDTPLNFRFASGSSSLDNRAFRDTGRLVEKLSLPQFANSKLLLIGFTDPKGDANKNLELSKQRAQQVQQELEAEGLKIEMATGFGEEPSLLLDSREDDPESLATNRRVEVWLQRP